MLSTTEHAMYVGGEWMAAHGPRLDVYDPVTGEVRAAIASATSEDVAVALRAASDAQPGWARTTSMQRGAIIREIAGVVEAHRDELADLITAEMGKPAPQARAELDFALGLLRYSAEWDRRLEGEILPGDVPDEVIHLMHAPVGVVAAICPWNFPLAVLCRKLGPALVTGNTLVIKPSEVSPLSTAALLGLIDEHVELPAGVLNLVHGAGETGAALVADPTTNMVSFTGHRDTGKAIMASAAEHLTRVALELGGKAPAIVWADADLDQAVQAVLAARHTNAGQVCTAAERVFVHRALFDEFAERYVAAVEQLAVGIPSAGADVGPLASAAQLTKTAAAVAHARSEGARIVTGGGRPEGDLPARGYWYAPTVLVDVEPTMQIMREETFGPVTPLFAIDSLEDVMHLANESRYGLSAYLFSRDYGTIMRAVDRLQFGEIYINRTLGESVHAHHAGFRESGIGGEDGKWGLTRYTQIKVAYHHFG